MRKCGWAALAIVAVACGGKARVDGDLTSSAGRSGASAGNTSAGAQSAGGGGTVSCPDGPLAAQPSEGDACPSAGLTCTPYGALSCPLTAVCSADLKWQITCSSAMIFGACTCPHPIGDRVPKDHRAAPLPVCARVRAAGPSSADRVCETADGGICTNSVCSQDAQCQSGANGRCLQLGPPPGYACSYDTCFADSDCAKGSVCQCREPLDGADPNYCTKPSNCRVDADCGVNGYCSPSQSHEWCGTLYACHTPDDQCLNDSDCPEDEHCDYSQNVNSWVCGNSCGPAPP